MWSFVARKRGAGTLALAIFSLGSVGAAPTQKLSGPPEVARAAAPGGEKKFRDALERGRSLASKGDLPAAAAALDEALAARPADSVALSELGLVAYRQRDLARAADLTRKAIALAKGARWDCVHPSPGRCIAHAGRVRAASLFNLGLILGASDDKTGAIDAYTRSLGEECSRGARERLITLDGDPPARCDSLVTRPMVGPFVRLPVWCEQEKKRILTEPKTDDSDFDMDGFTCTPEQPIGALADLPAQVQAVRVFASRDHGTRGSAETSTVSYHLALRLARGWYVCSYAAQAIGFAAHSSHGIAIQADLSLESLALGAPIAGTRTIRLVTKEIEDMDDLVNHEQDLRAHRHYEQSVLSIVGVGPSGQPRCTGRMPFRFSAWDIDGWETSAPLPGSKRNAQLKLKIDPDGKVDIAGPAELPAQDASAKSQYGRHRIRFP